jgi:hypothetical protein
VAENATISDPQRRYIVTESKTAGWIVHAEEFIVMPGIAAAPWYEWMPIDNTAKYCATWTEVERWLGTLKEQLSDGS